MGFAFEEAVGEGAFVGDEAVDFFFDAASGYEFVHEYVFLLADAEGAVGGLVFYGWVPPAVEVDDVAGGGEGEAGAAGFEGEHEERGAVFLLKGVDVFFALRDGGAAVEAEAGTFKYVGEEESERVDDFFELGKNQDFFLAGGDFFAELAEAFEFSAGGRFVFVISCRLAGVVADLLEPHEGGED